ncbi:MAG: peptidase family [Bacteroidota bacterium]|nr:peptidase family [Bacteroidota bacterium]
MKKQFKITSRTTIFIMAILAVFTTVSCKKTNSETSSVQDYSSIKTSDWKTKIGTEFTVEGFYDEENGVGKLYHEPKEAMIDAPAPQNNYILVSSSNQSNFSGYVGRKVRITGNLNESREQSLVTSASIFGDRSLAGLVVTKVTLIDSVSYFRPALAINFCERYPLICQSLVTPVQTKVALLYSGGIDAGNAHHRYWNDIYVMYKILKNNYGFTDANIVVVYKNGVADDHGDEVPVDYAASAEGLNAAMDLLGRKMGASTKFFCFINNHGGGYRELDGLYYGGGADTNADEPSGDAQHYDEDIFYYNEATDIKDDLLASKINALAFGTGIFVLKPCFSGGLVWDLRGANRVIISSGTERQVTYGHSSGNFGEMSHNFIAAISGSSPSTGAAVSADLNGDGKISMYEAYMYIKSAEEFKTDEQPQYNDDGSGNVTTTPSSSGFGAGVFL